jgi:hypothetical protein
VISRAIHMNNEVIVVAHHRVRANIDREDRAQLREAL